MYNLFMRTKSFLFFLLLGGAILGAAFFAEPIGLDNDAGWGTGRVALLAIGLLVIAWGIFYFLFTEKVSPALHTIRISATQFIERFQEFVQHYWFTFPVAAFVILIYVWFASSGSWTHWVSATRYYADLANAFEHGQLHLTTRPSRELLNLSNPYDPEQRKGIAFPIDYALYKGKFYMYWGPVPALMLVVVKPFVAGKVGDLILAFIFVSGIFLSQYLLLLRLWDCFFRHSPVWMLLLSILASGLSGPWMYMLVNEPNGRIYEAAISGAQFFLLGGLVVMALALAKSNVSYSSLALAGLLWGLAVGTRLVLAVPVGIVCIIITYRVWMAHPSFKNFLLKLIALGLPLGLCFVAIGWYNWARFGSFMNTGFIYSLAHQDMLKYSDSLFSPIYVFQNVYNYILNAPTIITHFPFLLSKGRTENIFPFLFSLPEVYQAQPITGLLYLAPISVFALIPFFRIRRQSGDPINSIHNVLFGTFFPAYCFLLLFFWTALRYMGDFLPELMLAGILGIWRGHQLLVHKPTTQKIYSILGIIFAIAGIIVSLLIALSANQYN